MNDNPEGTPNPLNPAPEAPVEAAPVTEPAPAPAVPESEPTAPVAVEPVAPTPKKKGRAGLIIGIILGVIALGCGVAAILIFFVFNKGGDPVTDAMTKLLNGDNRNVAVAGTFDYSSTGTPISVTYNAQVDTVAKVGVVTADISGSANGMSMDVNAEVRFPGDDKAYLKFSGIKKIFTDALKQSGIDCDSVDCDSYISMMLGDGTNTTSSSSPMSIFSSLISLDGKWIMFEANITDSFSLPSGMKLDDISSHKNEVVDTYKKYPFLKSSTNDLKIAKKNDTLYKIEFDYDKLASFTNELASKNGSSQTVTAADLQKSMAEAGDIYVEIDGNHNFTRLNVGGQDLAITYPSNVNVVAPDDYTTSDTLIEMFGGFLSAFTGGVKDCDSESDGCSLIEDDDDDDDDDYDLDWSWDDDED